MRKCNKSHISHRITKFCQIWILGFSEIAKPLFKTTASSDKDTLEWGHKQETAFREIKRLLTSAPALELLDLTWDFNLFIQRKITLHCGSSHSGPWQCLVAYLSKRLDLVTTGWPSSLQTLVATVVLVREADKLTLVRNINVKFPHAVTALMNS